MCATLWANVDDDVITLFIAPGCCALSPPWPPTVCCCWRASANRLLLLPMPGLWCPILGDPFIICAPSMFCCCDTGPPGCCCPLPFWGPSIFLFMLPTIPAICCCCIRAACCGERCCCPWGPMPCVPGEAFKFPKSPIEAPAGPPIAPCCGAAGAGPCRRSSESCLCLAAASWPLDTTPPMAPPPLPKLPCNWPRSPPFSRLSSEELISSSGRSCSRSKSEPKSTAGNENLEARLMMGEYCYIFGPGAWFTKHFQEYISS